MQLELAGKTVLVTGASRGIGLAIAQKFLEEGAIVALNARNGDALSAAASLMPVKPTALLVGDMVNPDEAADVVAKAIAALGGRLDILVCNVGSGGSVPPGHETAAEWHRVFGLNLWSATNAIEAAKDALCGSRGAIVCISSICGVEVVPGAPVTYSAAKAALNAYVRGIARPFGKDQVRINAIAPGNMLFDGSVWDRKVRENPMETTQMLERDVALARLGDVQSIADWAAWLASPRCNFVTGQIYVVDGGQVRT